MLHVLAGRGGISKRRGVPQARFPATVLEDTHNHPRQVFPFWQRAVFCQDNFTQVTERIYIETSQETAEKLVGRDFYRSYNPSSSSLTQDYCQQQTRSAGTLSSQVLKPRTAEHTVPAHLIPVQHELPTQEGFSKSLVWACQATVHDSCPPCHLPRAGKVSLFCPTIPSGSWDGFTCKLMLMKVDEP